MFHLKNNHVHSIPILIGIWKFYSRFIKETSDIIQIHNNHDISYGCHRIWKYLAMMVSPQPMQHRRFQLNYFSPSLTLREGPKKLNHTDAEEIFTEKISHTEFISFHKNSR